MTRGDIQPALDAYQNQLCLTFSSSDALTAKAMGILGFDVALLIYVLQSDFAHDDIFTIAFSLLAFFSLLWSNLLVIWPKDYIGAVANINEHEKYLLLTNDQLKIQLLEDTQKAVTMNTLYNSVKSAICMCSIMISLAWTILVITEIIIFET